MPVQHQMIEVESIPVKMSSDYRIVIPRQIRKKFKLKADSWLHMVINEEAKTIILLPQQYHALVPEAELRELIASKRKEQSRSPVQRDSQQPMEE